MKKQQTILFPAIFLCVIFYGCDLMATLFHGPEPDITYTVTFNANGAFGTAPETQTVVSGNTLYLPDKGNLSSTGNVFVGWSENSGGAGSIYSVGYLITVIRDMTFYAQWLDSSTPQYTVTFNPNGASGGMPPASQTVYSGVNISIPGQGTLTCSGKIFGGWNTQSNGGGTNYTAGASYTVTNNVTLYAKWQSEIQYTITYHANGASGSAPAAQTFDPGTEITLPGVEGMTYTGRIFKGWNTQANGSGTNYEGGASYTVNANAVLYAKWEVVPITPPGSTLAQQLAYVRNHTGNGTVFDIEVNNDEYLGPTSITSMGINITVNIRSVSPDNVRTIQLEGQGHLFSIDTGVTVRLQDIALRGHSTNNRALVGVGNGTLILNSGAKVTGNTNARDMGGDNKGGGIRVNGGILEINNGAEIIGNAGPMGPFYGGGIFVENRGTVNIFGGVITENSAKILNADYADGGGIYITGNSKVTMSGGIISKNQVSGWGGGGGGVCIADSGSSFTKRAVSGSSTSGIIYGSSGDEANIASRGNAVYRNFGSLRNRNTTLGPGDEITTLNDVGWE